MIMHIDYFGGETNYLIEVNGRIIMFELNQISGPIPLNKNGKENKNIGQKHAFWNAVSLWIIQGKRLNGNVCLWNERN